MYQSNNQFINYFVTLKYEFCKILHENCSTHRRKEPYVKEKQ